MNLDSSPDVTIAYAVRPLATKHEPLTYSVIETAQVLGVTAPTIYRLTARACLGRFPAYSTN